MARSLAGSRIREARRRAGMTQSALAKAVGISASYLNLIEHNRRRIGGKVLNAIAETLGTKPSDLAEGGDAAALTELQQIAAEARGTGPDPAEAEAFLGRFPAWAEMTVRLAGQVRDQQAAISALSDRLTHDPFLSENVHAMLSHITAIRATASILTQVDDMPSGQRARFHANIHGESLRLSDTGSGLAEYLGNAASRPGTAVTAEEALDQFLGRNDHRFATLDSAGEAAAGLPDATAQARLDAAVATLIDADRELAGPQARALAERHLTTYAGDARAMPLGAFGDAAARDGYDPARLAQRFAQPLSAVFRRLAVLARPGIDAPRFGLIVVTASGYPLLRQPLPDFALPRHGNACPLWPLFQGFMRPGQTLLDRIEHDSGDRFLTLSVAEPHGQPDFGAPADYRASMLILPEAAAAPEGGAVRIPPPAGPPRAVGTSCRICTRRDCTARAEPRLLGG